MKKYIKNCLICNKEFYRRKERSYKSWKKAKFCSHICFFESLKGKKRDEKTRKKISQGRKARMKRLGYLNSTETRKRMSEALKGHMPWNTGKYLSEDHKRKMVETRMKNNSYKVSEKSKLKMSLAKRGEKCYLWKGGITPLIRAIRTCMEYRQWHSDVFTRDDFTCQECGLRGVYLEAHHIKSFSEIIEEYKIKTMEEALNCKELWDINNGRTLCKNCHSLTKKGKPILLC